MDGYDYGYRNNDAKVNLDGTHRRKVHKWILASAYGLSFVLAIYASYPMINQEFSTTVDEHYYVDWLDELRKSDNLAAAFTEVNKGDRPLSLLFIYGIQTFTGLPTIVVVRFLPVILSPMLITVVYYFVKIGT